MPATTVNIPSDILKFMDSLVESGVAHSRRQIVVEALGYYRDLTMHEWVPGRITVRQLRRALMTQKSIEQLTLKMTDQDLYESGVRMSHTLFDSMLAGWRKDPKVAENHQLAFQLLSQIGWGTFTLSDGRLIINSPFLPKHLIRGYLAAALGLHLDIVQTIEDLAIFDIKSG